MIIPGTAITPEAGKVFRIRGVQVGVDSGLDVFAPGVSAGSVVRPDKVRCTVKIGQVRLPAVATNAWRVPARARGKTLMVKLTLAYGGDEVTEVYSLKIE